MVDVALARMELRWCEDFKDQCSKSQIAADVVDTYQSKKLGSTGHW